MRQLKNCKVGHFVKYNGILCQVNCFYTSMGERCATLVEVSEGRRRIFTPFADVKVEYVGETASDSLGNFWVRRRFDPFEQYYSK